MKNKFVSKITALVLTLMLMFTMIPSGMVFASERTFEFTLTTDEYSVSAGDVVELTVTVNGLVNDVSMVQYSIQFDPTQFSVDTPSRNPQKAFDAAWYAEISTADANERYSSFYDIAKPAAGQKVDTSDSTKKLFNSSYLSMDGFTIDSDSPIYGKTSVVAGKVEFTALADVADVASAFKLTSTAIQVNAVNKPVTTVQIPSLDMTAVNNVNALISAIPATVAYADKAKVEAAKTAYTALGDAEKALVTGADKITAAETAIAAIQTKIDNAKTLIDAIGDVVYPDSKAKIDAARDAYDALNADAAAKEAVTNYSKLTEAEAKYAELEQGAFEEAENKAAAAKVDAKIEAIGTVAYTAASKALIDEAEAAYKALTSAQVGFVNNKTVLDKAIADYKALNDEVVAVNNALAALDASAVKLADKAALAELRQQYADLDDNQEAAILPANLEKLVACEAKIEELEARKARIDAVEDKITAIGTVELTDASKAKIDAARSAYDNLNDDSERAEVENYSVLLAAEGRYAQLKLEAEQNAANKAAAEAVDAKIEAIGDVVYTDECKSKIEDAEAAYIALTDEQRVLVGNKALLDEKREQYDKKDNEYSRIKRRIAVEIGEVTIEDGDSIEILVEDEADVSDDVRAALDKYYLNAYEKDFAIVVSDIKAQYDAIVEKIQNVKNLIDAIGEVTLYSADAIREAESAYAELSDAEKGYVANYSILTQAREKYNGLLDDQELANEVIDAINNLPEVSEVTKDNVNTVSAAAASARSSYENLPDKTMVPTAIVGKLEAIEAACKTVKDDLAAAKVVEDLISAIGTVSLGSLEKIKAAEEAYAGLTGTQQSYVANYDVLEDARNTYGKLKAEQDAIDAVEALIDAIGEVDLCDDCKANIEAAEAAYDALDDTLKTRVENYQTLLDARKTYDELVASQARVDAVIGKIDAIGEVTLGSLADIQAAEAAYEALSDDEKDRVENYQTLLDARDEYEALKAAADKEEADKAAALGVDNMIAALGEEDITLESEADIKAARAAYEALTEDQKAYVNNLAALDAAEATLEGLKADKAAIDEVIDAISQIGEVVYPDSKDAIDAAQAAYDNLADNLKDRVTNYYVVLTAAQQKYEALEADYNAVQNVIELIDAIGEVEYTVAVKERIDAAEEAYLALREEIRADVTNADVLEDAKVKYEELKPVIGETEEAVAEYGDKYMMVIKNLPAGKKVTVDGVEAFEYVEGEDVYYVALGSSKLNAAAIIVEDGTSNTLLMGDTNGDGTVDANDAFAANNKSANCDVASYTDAMAFVRSDINGSGTITAYDALMIARIAAGVQGVVVNFAAGKDNVSSGRPSAGGGASGGSSAVPRN